MLAARADALLRVGRARQLRQVRRGIRRPQKHGLELVHARVGKQERGVVVRDDGRGRERGVAFSFEKFDKGGPHAGRPTTRGRGPGGWPVWRRRRRRGAGGASRRRARGRPRGGEDALDVGEGGGEGDGQRCAFGRKERGRERAGERGVRSGQPAPAYPRPRLAHRRLQGREQLFQRGQGGVGLVGRRVALAERGRRERSGVRAAASASAAHCASAGAPVSAVRMAASPTTGAAWPGRRRSGN